MGKDRQVDNALPSHDDELALYSGDTPQESVARIADQGVHEVALKNGAAGPYLWPETEQIEIAPASLVVDTTGAGDAFNAGYLAARLVGKTQGTAATAGHGLAIRVIANHGAILPRQTP